jgi:RND family efflux transporter MFP subunit
MRAAWLVGALALAGAAAALLMRQERADALARQTQAAARPYVSVVSPKSESGAREIRLPATLEGAAAVPIYARSSGYVAAWLQDIGAHVHEGQLLARIDSPELEQQVAEAKAARAQAGAGRVIAQQSRARWERLRAADLSPQQELDERRAAEEQARAMVAASDANLARLNRLAEFQRVVAPFAGVITRRDVEVGQLVGAGAPGDARPLFTLTRTDALRLQVYVPQAYAAGVHEGLHVTVESAEAGGPAVDGLVRRTAGALDPATRTLQVEVDLPNERGALLPGAYVQVRLPAAGAKAQTLPGSTLLFRRQGTVVAVVDAAGRVKLQPVKVGRDLGGRVEVSGIAPGAKVIASPSDSIEDGDAVTVVAPAGA